MVEYLNAQQEIFFTWCDQALKIHLDDHEGAVLKRWRPRKHPDGSYELVFELAVHDGATARFTMPIPVEFHELLEREYFINHPPLPKRKRGGLVLIVNNRKQ